MLGHAEIETTMRYAKVVDRLREMDMCKWDSLVGIGAGPVGGADSLVKIECPECGSVGSANVTSRFSDTNVTLRGFSSL